MPGEPLPGGSAGELFAPGACTEAADAADKLGASAPLPDAQPVPKEPSAREVAASDQMNEAAEKHGVMWARVKGFPHWPVRACFSPLFTCRVSQRLECSHLPTDVLAKCLPCRAHPSLITSFMRPCIFGQGLSLCSTSP